MNDNAWLTFQYTLTETHLGGAGAKGAVDLPIVRESTTDLPFLPDTALKGVARHSDDSSGDEERLSDRHKRFLFGRGPTQEDNDAQSAAGRLVFTQGHLLLYPLRSLQRPFLYATCPLLLSRFDRLTRAFGCSTGGIEIDERLFVDKDRVRVADGDLFQQDLVVEGLAWEGTKVQRTPEVAALGEALSKVLPKDEQPTSNRLKRNLVVLPDQDFVALLRSAPPVRARIAIAENTGTTSGDGGNLWYEEMLPPDCLFWSVVELHGGRRRAPKGIEAALSKLFTDRLRHTQIGAGRSTGHGRAWWWRVEAS